MKHGKKILCVVLALLLMLSTMAGCTSDTDATEPSESQTQPTTENTNPTESTNPTETTEATETTEPTQATEATEPTKETEPVHTHSWKSATCTAPKTCKTCGATSGNANGHNWKAATCTAPKTCSTCGATSGNALGHTHEPVTCTKGATCTVCGTAIPAAGHKYADATCTAPKTCSTCGATTGSALGHSYKDATCTAPKTCSTCGATEGNALGHNYQNGTCTRCGDVETVTHPFVTGGGYAITLSSTGTRINCYQLSSTEMFEKSYTATEPTEGNYEFREYNGTTYYASAMSWGWREITSYTISGRTIQLQVGSEIMELELISANQYKVTKGVESFPTGIVLTYGASMCDVMGHLYSRSCEGDVTCRFCDHVKCAGLGHEYDDDGICYRCYAAMRPSE